jgi:hypothetical protein
MMHRQPDERQERRVEFLGEQDGPSERELKAVLRMELGQFPFVQRAYLARIGFAPNDAVSVALCIAPASKDDRAIVTMVNRVFGERFTSATHLDIVFVNPDQEADLRRVCRSFL